MANNNFEIQHNGEKHILKWNAGAFRFYQRNVILVTDGGDIEGTTANLRFIEVLANTAAFLLERAGLTSDQIDDLDGDVFATLCNFCSDMGTSNMETVSGMNKKKSTPKIVKT